MIEKCNQDQLPDGHYNIKFYIDTDDNDNSQGYVKYTGIAVKNGIASLVDDGGVDANYEI
ncbi:hypothetical protein [Eupransor demetentiae]|uniref:Uncharacterized protein n=1 Tax=Eupransor demetentiae TaxID=3109584 RepID=A0ABM9N6R1_9LACO|nr:hypothetical protein R54876_GBNLAHCA_01507 [Lactobacillaceae bacterium LMG 33000]